MRGHACQQRDVAFDARDEDRRFGIREPQLMQRADAVGIAVEGIELRHCRHLSPGLLRHAFRAGRSGNRKVPMSNDELMLFAPQSGRELAKRLAESSAFR